ncbi:MAG: CDP-alcohol phosphatidyltransferase family protein [Thiolinea sp.]
MIEVKPRDVAGVMQEQIPNIITTLRIAAIAPICWLLWHDAYAEALVWLLLAGLSDGLDGYLARRYGWFTRLGAILDPIADKLFIVSITLLFGAKAYLPGWLVLLILGRDVVIVCGALAYRWVTGALDMRPLLVSKVNTALQILLLAVTLLHVGFYALPLLVTESLQWLVALMTVWSGAAYIFWWSYYALHKENGVSA